MRLVNELEEIIREEIRVRGPMRFDRYMELALYHPQHGYYAEPRRIGRGGDFFTSVSVGPLFGHLLARQARQMWHLLGNPRPFWIIEQGAHDGSLAGDILEKLREAEPDFFEALRYGIIEPQKSFREAQFRSLGAKNLAGHVHWRESLDAVVRDKPLGLFLCNELVDAFPVRLVRRVGGEWKERCVEIGNAAELSWRDSPVVDFELRSAIEQVSLPPVEGYVTEVHLAARSWMGRAAHVLDRGYMLVIDYGFPASVYYAPFRTGGTLTAYQNHKRTGDVLLSLGRQDLTAHVEFTALARAAGAGGLVTLGLIDQQRFLMGVAHEELSGVEKHPVGIARQVRAWNTLTHPEHLGSRFQVLVLAKDAPANLDGLRHARPGGLD